MAVRPRPASLVSSWPGRSTSVLVLTQRPPPNVMVAQGEQPADAGRRVLDVLTPLSDLQTRIRRKDGTENFGGFVYVLDGFPQRDFVLWVFMCPIKISLICVSFMCLFCLFFSLFSGYHAEGYHAPSIPHRLSRIYHHCTATTPVYIYPGNHA